MNKFVDEMNTNLMHNTYFDVPSFNLEFTEDEHSNSFSLVHFNSRSLSHNFDNINMYLSSISHTFKIIGLTETWLNSSSPTNMYSMNGYKFFCNNRKNKRGGGTGLYIHNSLHCSLRKNLTVLNESFESIFVEMSNNTKCKKTIIGVVYYRPPGQNIDIFLSDFAILLNKINIKSCNCIIMGDLNIDLTRSSINSKVN